MNDIKFKFDFKMDAINLLFANEGKDILELNIKGKLSECY